ncbi:sodium:proton antiporter [Salinarimonas sp. NSM]|uniref:sodium:proton antiporter n=1 Tax=Salinarimonas sp. NSM TaxID=3458003 RepID=UPI00403585FF
MTLVYAITIAAYVGCGLYMMLSRHAVRMILGLTLLTNGAIFLIFFSGRIGSSTPPVIPQGADALAADAANALPQALVLTAIVIGFALTAFAVALALKAYRSLGTLDVREMRDAEALGAPDLPLSTPVKNHG